MQEIIDILCRHQLVCPAQMPEHLGPADTEGLSRAIASLTMHLMMDERFDSDGECTRRCDRARGEFHGIPSIFS